MKMGSGPGRNGIKNGGRNSMKNGGRNSMKMGLGMV